MLGIKNRNILALWGLVFLFIIPFNVSSRFLPYTSFYQDIIVVVLALSVCSIVLLNRQLTWSFPRGMVYFLLLSFYWLLQPLLIELPYSNQNVRVALLFILMATLTWSIQGLLQHYGRELIVIRIAWAVFIGASFQTIVVLLQFSGMSELVSWFVFDSDGVKGQFGQRNLLGHYIMWGILAVAYLMAKQRLNMLLGIIFILVLGGGLALVGSRTIVAYVLAILLLLFIVSIFFRRSNYQVVRVLFFSVCWVLLAQWLVPHVLDSSGIATQSGLERLVERPDAQFRTPEWSKAWQSFLNAPLFGHGWHSYTYQSIVTDWDIIPDTQYHLNGYALHSHNIVLQILSEMGIIGGLLVFGGLLWVVLPLFKRLNKGYCLWVFSLLAVTACHSLLEFPLWYSYFLAAAVVFLALAQPLEKTVQYLVVDGFSRQILLLFSGLGLMAVIFALGLNQWFIHKHIKAVSDQPIILNNIRAKAMFDLGQSVPLLTPYGDMKRIEEINLVKNELSEEDIILIEKFNRYLPVYFMAQLRGLSLHKQKKYTESIDWMKKVWHYYPRQIPHSMRSIYQASPLFKELEIPVYQACMRQKEIGLYEEIKICPEPSVENLNKIKK